VKGKILFHRSLTIEYAAAPKRNPCAQCQNRRRKVSASVRPPQGGEVINGHGDYDTPPKRWLVTGRAMQSERGKYAMPTEAAGTFVRANALTVLNKQSNYNNKLLQTV
jgi:hypothetical protein